MKKEKTIQLNEIVKQVGTRVSPPVHLWNPDFCGDIDMIIKKDGSWHYMGTPILRESMVRLFSSILRKDADGKTYLVTPVEKVGITVEDAPFVIIAMECSGSGEEKVISFVTNTGDIVTLDKDHPLRINMNTKTKEPRPYVLVRGNLEALVSRPVFYDMVDQAFVEDNVLCIKSAGHVFQLGAMS